MALFHFHVTQIKRSAGQSVVTSAAYRAGEKLYSEYYGEVSDYTHKGGVVCTDILLPPQAPVEYKDRATLWNAVEKAERGKKAQLAYSFDIALQNEFFLEENIALARQFVSEQLVGQGMIADFAIHQPDKEDGGIPNPHFHVLCPIRPIEESGKWGCKQRRRYHLDEDGNRIMGEDGKALFDAVLTTDWGSPETLEHWREAWAAMVNAKFEEKGLMCRIDHRSYARQDLDLLPTVHEGVAVRQMEAKGITTDKGDLNRWVKAARKMLGDIRRKIASLTDWIKAIKDELSKPQAPDLAGLLISYYNARNAGAWSQKARIGNLKHFAKAVNYLTENDIATLEDLEARIKTVSDKKEAVNDALKAMSARKKELEDLLHLADLYRETKPVYDKWKGIKWKGKREDFEREHEGELRTFHMTRRKLDKHRSLAGKIPVQAWRQELAEIQRKYPAEYEQYTPLRDDLAKLLQMKNCVNTVLRQQEQTRQKRWEMER
nr:MobQ family relaxase [uncultured Oscillibacter sp.]